LGLVINAEARVADWCLGVKADARELATAGRHGTLSVEELERRVATLEEAGKAQAALRDKTLLVAARLGDAARAAGNARTTADKTRLERQIWIHGWLRWLPTMPACSMRTRSRSGSRTSASKARTSAATLTGA
jgi:hypothetical protein